MVTTTAADPRIIFEISNNYRFVLISALLNVFVYFCTMMLGGSSRKEYFTEAKMSEKFGEEHEKAGLGKIKKGGYPD